MKMNFGMDAKIQKDKVIRMFTVENYIGSIESNLTKQTDLLVENLKEVLSNEFSEGVQLLDFNAFLEPTRFELSLMMFSMDTDGNEVFVEDGDIGFADSVEVLPEVNYYKLDDEQLDAFFDFYEENEEVLVERERHVFSAWFTSCWEKAGGNEQQLPSFFGLHDGYESFDLKNGEWVDDEAKWE